MSFWYEDEVISHKKGRTPEQMEADKLKAKKKKRAITRLKKRLGISRKEAQNILRNRKLNIIPKSQGEENGTE